MEKNDDYQRVSLAINYLQRNPQAPLRALAEAMGLSESHCHRLFHQWAGITPKQFQRFIQRQHCLQVLRASGSLLEASWQAGLSGPGRLHDLIVHWEGMSPGEYRRNGRGLTLTYGRQATPLGWALLVSSDRGLCHLSFADRPESLELAPLQARWQGAEWHEDPRGTADTLRLLFPTLEGERWAQRPPPLHLWGTPFQHKVWQALLAVPAGALCSYAGLARAAGVPGAARAVGSAVGANPISLLIPCHRVIRTNGELGHYRWGDTRKAALVGRELAADCASPPRRTLDPTHPLA